MRMQTLMILEDAGFTRKQAMGLAIVIAAFVHTGKTLLKAHPEYHLPASTEAYHEAFDREMDRNVRRIWERTYHGHPNPPRMSWMDSPD
jgi:hypothetical protein